LQARVRSLKLEVSSLKTSLASCEKEVQQLKADEKARDTKLEHFERENEALLEEAAGNG